MLNTLYQDFKQYLEETFPAIKIDEYRGEFKEKSPAAWNPIFPCCLIKLTEYAPLIRAAAGEIIKQKTDFTLYYAEKNSEGFSDIQQIIDELNGINLLAGSDCFLVQVNSVKFLTALNAVRVHTIDVSII